MIKYKFTVDPNLVPNIQAFLQKNPTLFSTKPEIKQNANISAHVKFITDNENSLFKFHKFLLKIHLIESNLSKKDIKEPVVNITLNGTVSYKAYFNYLLSAFFCQCLKENSIDFSITKIKERYFHLWECVPVSITKSDFKQVKRMINNSPLRNYKLIDLFFNIIAED